MHGNEQEPLLIATTESNEDPEQKQWRPSEDKKKLRLLPQIYKPLLKLNSKKTNNPVKRWVKILTGEGYGNPFQYSCL